MARRWTEEAPHDVERLTAAGTSLRGRLDDGRMVAARAIAVTSEEEAERLVARLHGLADLADPRLLPVLGAVREPTAVWVLAELDAGTPLRALLARGPLPVPLAAAIAIEMLTGLAALEAAGLGHGALHAGNVHVAGDGRVRLGDFALQSRFDDVAAAGSLLCAALGVSERPGGGEPSEAERTAPALVSAARALVGARPGRSPATALAMVHAAVGRLADRARHDRHLVALGRLAAGTPAALEPAQREPIPPEPAAEGSTWPQPAAPYPAAHAPEPAVQQPAAHAPEQPPGRGPARRLPWPAWAAGLVLAAVALGGAGAALGAATAHRTGPAESARAPSAVASGPAAAGSPARRDTTSPSEATAPLDLAPAPEATPPHVAPAPQPPAAPVAGDPAAAVSRFYQLVQQHQFDAAVQLWSARMQATYPPGENVRQRFADTTSLTLQREQVTTSGDASAAVSIDLVEVRAGTTYRWTGTWYLIRDGSGWLLDQPALHPA